MRDGGEGRRNGIYGWKRMGGGKCEIEREKRREGWEAKEKSKKDRSEVKAEGERRERGRRETRGVKRRTGQEKGDAILVGW